WIAAQGVPHRTQIELAVRWTVWDFRNHFELLDRKVAFASPRIDPCQVEYKLRTARQIFCDRHEFDCLPAFAECLLFSPACSVDNGQPGERGRVVRRGGAVRFLLLGTSGSKGGLGSNHVSLR